MRVLSGVNYIKRLILHDLDLKTGFSENRNLAPKQLIWTRFRLILGSFAIFYTFLAHLFGVELGVI